MRRAGRRRYGAGAVECIEGRVAYRDLQHARDHGVSGLVMRDGLFLPQDKPHNLLTKAAGSCPQAAYDLLAKVHSSLCTQFTSPN
jgi:hypothetical protein